jgi:hypothetical protein
MSNETTKPNKNILLGIMVGICIPLIVYGASIETRFGKGEMIRINQGEDIIFLKSELKESLKINQLNFDKVLKKLHSMDLDLKDKKDRE